MSGKRGRTREAPARDRHRLYQASVQAPDGDIEFFDRVYRSHRGKPPLALREDFCGTALFSRQWVLTRPDRTALAVDFDAEALAWGREHNLAPAGRRVAERVRLVHADVRAVRRPRVDIACAMNFSFCTLLTRRDLLAYFEAARAGLRNDGMLILEHYGGTEAMTAIVERREVDDFVYVWEQESFNPITHAARCHIHFELPDGSRLERAFSYDWRLWTLPEVRDALAEVGFGATEVYWERVDEEGDGTGEYERTEVEENQECWLVYLVALR